MTKLIATANGRRSAAAIGATGEGRLTSVYEYSGNVPVETKNPAAEAATVEWRKDHDTDFCGAEDKCVVIAR